VRFPRPWRLRSFSVRARFGGQNLSGEFIPSEALVDDLRNDRAEPVAVSDEVVFGGTMIKAECLLVQISKQMERFRADIRPFQSPLEQAPKVFESVGVDSAIHLFFGVVDYLMGKIFIQPLIGH